MSGTTIWLSHRKGWLTKAECVAQIERNTHYVYIANDVDQILV